MSVGGKVIEVVKVEEHKVWVNTLDHGVKCAVYCDPNGEKISVGDTLWWQGGSCFWTANGSEIADVRFEKIGFSGVSRP